jgi:hypothetical protein
MDFHFTFNGIIVFEFPIEFQIKSPSASKMHGMDKKDDGHAETITITTNIMNNDNLVLRNSCYIRPLCCEIANYSNIHMKEQEMRLKGGVINFQVLLGMCSSSDIHIGL